MKVALLKGHARRSEGAVCCAGYFKDFGEYALAEYYLPGVADTLVTLGHDAVITCREENGGVSPMYAAGAANDTGAEIALEWHFNSATPAARGCEVLYWGPSRKGQQFAELLSARMAQLLGVPNRGAKAITSQADRGYNFFRYTRMPAFIVEPCFAGSNADDARVLGAMVMDGTWQVKVARALHETISDVYKKGV